jgi:ParB/RepB/Spo0J family partition protein
VKIALTKITPDPDQPRRRFDESALDQLARSMDSIGQAQPILVREADDGFVIVAGERRWRAAGRLEWEHIDAEVVSRDTAVVWLQLAENLARADLSPIEEARAYRALVDAGHSHREIGEKVGKSKTQISQKLRLLEASPVVVELLDAGLLTEGHARVLLTLRSFLPADQTEPSMRMALARVESEDDAGLSGAERWWSTWVGYHRCEDWPNGYVFVMAKLLGAVEGGDDPEVGVEHGTLIAACARAAMDHDEDEVPAWWRPVSWFAMLAALADLSVVDLRDHVEGWKERIEAALVWLGIFPTVDKIPAPKRLADGTTTAELDQAMWWSYASDLRHAGIDRPEGITGTDVGTLEGRLAIIGRVEGMPLPSAFQRWSPQRERWVEIYGEDLAGVEVVDG